MINIFSKTIKVSKAVGILTLLIALHLFSYDTEPTENLYNSSIDIDKLEIRNHARQYSVSAPNSVIHFNPSLVESQNLQGMATPHSTVSLPSVLGQFTGRVKLLDLLNKACNFESWRPLQPRRWLHIYGLAGLGKSETAIAFANQHLDKISLVWHITCENDLLYDAAYRTLAQTLNIPLDKDNTEQVVRKVHLVLENWQEQKPWLLILDNAEKAVPMPARGGIVITTSQSESLGSENPTLFSLEPFDLLETEQFLLNSGLQPEQLDELEELHEEFLGWPLLVSQVPSYLSNKKFKVSDYLKVLKSIDPLFNKEEFSKYPRSLGQAFSMTYAAIKKSYTEAARLLDCCAYLDPNVIEEKLFESWYPNTPSLVWNKKTIDPLKNRSILRTVGQRHAFTLHRLWQVYLQRYLDNEDRAKISFEETLNLIERALSEFDKEKTTTWEQGKLGSFHLMRLRSFELWKNVEVKTRSGLLNKAGIWWQECKGIPTIAAEHFRENLEIIKAISIDPCFDPDVAMILNNLAKCYYSQGKYTEVLKLESQALEIGKAVFGDQHPEVAASLNIIANCYAVQGNYIEALKLQFQALEIRKSVLGDRHVDVAGSLNNIAIYYFFQGNYIEALRFHFQALEINKAIFGDQHFEIAMSLHNIGVCYNDQGNYIEALKFYTQALVMRKAVFGDQHPQVAASLNSIANCYVTQGNYTEALKLYTQALEIRKSMLGDRHSSVAGTLNGMAECYYDQENYTEAFKLNFQALEIRKAVFGDRHPETAASLNNLGVCYYATGHYMEALQFHFQALEIRKSMLGDRHLEVAESLNNVANCYTAQGNYTEALKLHLQALEIRKAVAGLHSDVATSLNDMAEFYAAQGNYTEALKLYTQAFEIRKAVFGDQHPLTVKSAKSMEQCSKKP